MNKKYFMLSRILGFLLLISVSCKSHDKKQIDFNVALKGVLFETISRVVTKYGLNQDTIIYYEIYPDNIKSLAIESILNENKNISDQNKSLLILLNKNIKDSVNINIHKIINNFYLETRLEKVKEIMHSQKYFGLISLINPVLIDDNGLFYLAIQCGNDCGDGYIVFFERIDNRFEITDIVQVWG